MALKLLFLFSAASLIILIQFILLKNIINGNDLNGNIVPLLYFKQSVTKNHQFPQWNPYMDQGIPSVADPLYGVYNPLISIPILIFDYEDAIKITYFLAILLSCLSMFTLAMHFKISERISVIISITYAASSYISSRIVAGHLEKIVSYAFLPLFIFSLTKVVQSNKVLWSGVCAIVISLILFSGDIYNALYCLYATAAVMFYYLFKDRKISSYLLLTFILFLLFSSIKILPMLELQNHLSKIREPFLGNLNILSFVYSLFFPFDSIFSKFFPINYYSTGFGWWENLAFIGPLSIFGLYLIFRNLFNKHSKEISLLVVLSILFIFLSLPGIKLNPFHYLITIIKPLQFFHVPSRILALWSVIILLGLGLWLDRFRNKSFSVTFSLINLFIVFIFSQTVIARGDFFKPQKKYESVIEWIKNNNPDNYYTVHSGSQGEIPQDQAFLNNLLMLQSNYGLFIKSSLAEGYNFRDAPTYEAYKDIKPGFLITNSENENQNLEKLKVFSGKIFVYKDNRSIPFTSIKKIPQKVSFDVNKITIHANSEESNRLTLLESNYPGWNAYIDGKKANIINGRFLEITTLKGNHRYEFIFFSKYLTIGLLISIVSFLIWGFYVINYDHVIAKKTAKKR